MQGNARLRRQTSPTLDSRGAAYPGAPFNAPGQVELLKPLMRPPGDRAYLDDHQGVHHVVLFVLQNMAVPHVLGSLDAETGFEPRTVRWFFAGWQIKFHVHRDHFSGVHPHGFLPALLVLVRWTSRARNGGEYAMERLSGRRIERPGLPLPDGDVDQVEVHGVSIAGEVVDLPTLDLTSPRYFRRKGGIPRYAGSAEILYQAAITVEDLIESLDLGPLVGPDRRIRLGAPEGDG